MEGSVPVSSASSARGGSGTRRSRGMEKISHQNAHADERELDRGDGVWQPERRRTEDPRQVDEQQYAAAEETQRKP